MMTVDGFYEGSNGEFDFWTDAGDEFDTFSTEQLDAADTPVFGRAGGGQPHRRGGELVRPVCERGAAPDPDPTHGVDYAAGDVLASYDRGVAATLAAFAAPGAQERIIKLPFGELPGAVFMGIATNDVFTHGWDLAKASAGLRSLTILGPASIGPSHRSVRARRDDVGPCAWDRRPERPRACAATNGMDSARHRGRSSAVRLSAWTT